MFWASKQIGTASLCDLRSLCHNIAICNAFKVVRTLHVEHVEYIYLSKAVSKIYSGGIKNYILCERDIWHMTSGSELDNNARKS